MLPSCADDPLQLLDRPRRHLRAAHAIGCTAITLGIAWCATAMHERTSERSRDSVGSRGVSLQPSTSSIARPDQFVSGLTPLDLAVFDAPLWVASPEPPKPPKPPVPEVAPPLRLRLVGIEVDQAGSTALLFDPDAAMIVRAAIGDTVGRGAAGQTVRSIDAAAVVLESPDRRFVHRLELRQRVSLKPSSISAGGERGVP